MINYLLVLMNYLLDLLIEWLVLGLLAVSFLWIFRSLFLLCQWRGKKGTFRIVNKINIVCYAANHVLNHEISIITRITTMSHLFEWILDHVFLWQIKCIDSREGGDGIIPFNLTAPGFDRHRLGGQDAYVKNDSFAIFTNNKKKNITIH